MHPLAAQGWLSLSEKPSRFATYVFAFGEYVACGTLWVLSRVGKYLVRPQADETSHKKQIPCGRQEKGLPFFSPHRKGYRLCGGDQGAFRSPPGPLRGPSLYVWAKPPTRNKLLAEGRKRVYLSFPYRKGFRLCGGDQRAFRSPFGNLRPFAASRNLYIKQLPCGRQETGLTFFSRITKDFASAEATKGLSGRPLETFGPLLQCKIGICKKAFSCCWQETGLPFFRREKTSP